MMAVLTWYLLAAVFLAPAPAPRPSSAANWPGADSSLKSLSGSTATVIAGVAKGKAEVQTRHAAHLSTRMSLGDGEVIKGGGVVISAQCRQRFRVLEVLHGEGKTEDRVLEYEFVERAQGFPLPGQEVPIPDGASVLLLLDRKGGVLKALPDNAENRKAVRAALPRKEERKKQVPE